MCDVLSINYVPSVSHRHRKYAVRRLIRVKKTLASCLAAEHCVMCPSSTSSQHAKLVMFNFNNNCGMLMGATSKPPPLASILWGGVFHCSRNIQGHSWCPAVLQLLAAASTTVLLHQSTGWQQTNERIICIISISKQKDSTIA